MENKVIDISQPTVSSLVFTELHRTVYAAYVELYLEQLS
jgi:hypothetical protein